MNKQHIVANIVDYIEEHLDEDLSLDSISDALGYSKFYMSRCFSDEAGLSIYKYIQGRRITLAAQALIEQEKTILDIAYEAQYNSPQAFTLAFHQLYGCSPQTYRRNGIFYPLQERLLSKSLSFFASPKNDLLGGQMAA